MDIRKINLTAIGIIVVIFLIVFFALFKDSRAKVVVLKANKTLLMEKLRSSGDMALKLDKIKEEITVIQDNLDDFDRQLPGEKRIHDFITEIDKMAKKKNMRLKSIRPGKIEKGALYSRVPINITGNSKFKDFYSFLYQLENIPRITVIDRLHVKGSPDDNRCDIEMDLAVFISSH